MIVISKKPIKLTNNQANFCHFFIEDRMTQAEAYLKAYPSTTKETTARANSSRLLTLPKVKAYIKQLQAELRKTAILSIEERRIYLTQILLDGTEDVIKNKRQKDGSVETIVVKETISTMDKLRALDTLNKMDGAYTTNVNVEGNIKNPYAELSTEELKKLADLDD